VPHADALLQVFGATGHMGRSIVKTCLSHGDKVTAVGRVGEHTLDQMQGWHDSCLGLLCDVRVSQTVESVIQNTIRHFGAVDVIVKSVYPLESPTHAILDLIIDATTAALDTASLGPVKTKMFAIFVHNSRQTSSAVSTSSSSLFLTFGNATLVDISFFLQPPAHSVSRASVPIAQPNMPSKG
jgi:NAD(P)-dependent dehydrogenase (short-subunit alcohol dehydrogenase family)